MSTKTSQRKNTADGLRQKPAQIALYAMLSLGLLAQQAAAQDSADGETASQKILSEIKRLGNMSTQQAEKLRELRLESVAGKSSANKQQPLSLPQQQAQESKGLSELLERQQELEQNLGEALLAKASSLESQFRLLIWVFVIGFILALLLLALMMLKLIKRQDSLRLTQTDYLAHARTEPVLHPGDVEATAAPSSSAVSPTTTDAQNLPAPAFAGGTRGVDATRRSPPPSQTANPQRSATPEGAKGISNTEYGDLLTQIALKNQAEFMSRQGGL